jgi:RimJ/RimL family protein N-acetyltransferase
MTLRPGLLRGERVYLAALDEGDIAAASEWTKDSDYLRLYDSRPAAPRTAAELGVELREAQRSQNDFLFGLRLRESDQLIGLVGLDGISWPHGTAFLSIGIGEARHRGQGYGREAMALLLRFAFDELNLHRLCLTVFAYNEGAIALYESLGFTREGVYREHLHRDGQHHDMILYGILRREWQEQRDERLAAP